jgi:hypothetical protein
MGLIKQQIVTRILPLLLVVASLILLSGVTTGAAEAADSLRQICAQNPDAAVCEQYRDTRGDTAGNNSVVRFMGEVVSMLLFGLGIAGVIGVIAGGLYYVLSGGDPQKTQMARKIIIYSLAGVVIGILSQLIITFVLDRLNL